MANHHALWFFAMSSLSPDFLKKVEDRATERCLQITNALTDRLIVNGETYGDIPLNKPSEFVAFYVDLDKRGVLPHLEVVNPKLAEQYARRFQRDAAEVLGLRDG